ncbi:restriction endonuclease [Lactobacillus sp. PV037]|nr:restriction endonuclease [Lactobacillus sp. PV037]
MISELHVLPTTRVAIQAKRWNLNTTVSSPEIDKFRGAMDKFRAEYGIFITTTSFTRGAINAARSGTRVITLIDGEKLLDLVAKYQVFVKPKVVYELDKEFFE